MTLAIWLIVVSVLLIVVGVIKAYEPVQADPAKVKEILVAFHRDEVLTEVRKMVAFDWNDRSPDAMKAGEELCQRLVAAGRQLSEVETGKVWQ